MGGNVLSSSDGRDFNLEGQGILTGAVTATFVPKTSLSGTVVYAGGSAVNFALTYDPAFEATPSLGDLSGVYSGQAVSSSGVQVASVTINSSGQVSGRVSGCQFTGLAGPRSDANAFDLSVSFGGSPCLFANQTLSGLAYYNAVTGQVIALAPNASRTDGFMAVGTKH
jgi:hypothetical protein